MINPDELAICKRRGHSMSLSKLLQGWQLCKWCGAWVREVTTIEERDDEPPKDEQEPLGKLLR